MNYRNLLIASLVTGVVASCSLNPKDDTSAVPDITKTNRTDLIEINASLQPPAPSIDFRPAPTEAPTPIVTRKRVEFVIGDEGPATSNPAVTDYSRSGPIKLAPTYPERSVPSQGMSRDMVVAQRGQPAKKLAGRGNSEVWDYGTYRVFFHNDQVAFSRVW